jgi:hypothetical protein
LVTRVLHLHDKRHMQSLRHQDGSPLITQLKQRRSVTVLANRPSVAKCIKITKLDLRHLYF